MNRGIASAPGAAGAVPILTYHSLDESGSVISIPPATFAAQMRTLADRGFTGIPLSTLLDAWDGRGRLPQKPVALTFDDGFANFAEHARSALDDVGFRATVFVIAGLVGHTNSWAGQALGIPALPLLSWAQIEELVREGFDIGAHTVTHPRLPVVSTDEAAREVTESRRILEERLGRPVRTFAYPFGQVGGMRDLVGERYEAACGTRLATAGPGDDRYELPRIDMYYLRHPATFRLFGSPAGAAYIGLRRAGNGVRRLLERAGILLPA